ncbi:TPA: DNA polymerase III subunit gamma/tau [Candidatus Saccharibacteria bacterium]|nr:MAG: DNA polymerase III, subunit gamma and tau [Candidatus Saccharibacteria bacterium RIFCSPHIGHO2_12_FULL_47_17]HCM52296.1 DNA polymerase III subunit gamma/tau [Candidatus Saccharibacteria bacterium]
MGQALYRKYRPRKFSQIVGQDAIVDTLIKAIKSGRISHAYLFSGPRGVGKTSVARILAHEVNKLPYTDEAIHLDIIEIDAASNRRIDEVRNLRDKIHIVPTAAKFKVYIIDEVHMLTKEAFNALLKTLEEPPTHCIFILATTEPHKLPETIVSRTQQFSFKPVGVVVATDHINHIAKTEKIDVEPEALELLAEFGEGSFRDSISLLDQVSGLSGKITADRLRDLLGLPTRQLVEQFKKATAGGNLSEILKLAGDFRDQAVNPVYIAKQLARSLRDDLIDAKPDYALWLTEFLKQLSEVSAFKQPAEKLEIVLLEATVKSPAYKQSGQHVAQTIDNANTAEARSEPTHPKKSTAKANGHRNLKGHFSLELWPNVLAAVKDQAGPLHSALRLAAPDYEDGVLKLGFSFPLHRNKAKKAENLQLLGQIIRRLSGENVMIDCVVDKNKPLKITLADGSRHPPPANELQTISNIFGPSEMLES